MQLTCRCESTFENLNTSYHTSMNDDDQTAPKKEPIEESTISPTMERNRMTHPLDLVDIPISTHM
jgi:hypothetical protein